MGSRIVKNLPLALLTLLFLSTSADAFLKCKDSSGQWHFSDTTAGLPESCLKRKDEIDKNKLSKKSEIEKEKIAELAREKAKAIALEKEAKADKKKKRLREEAKAKKEAQEKAKKELQASAIARARLRLAQARAGAMQNGETQEFDPILSTVIMSITILSAVIFMAGLWKTFIKAGQPGWAIFVPIYNFLILIKVAEKPWWWILMLLVPIVNLIALILIYIEIAKRFGKSTMFAFGLLFLGVIFFPVLGFGKTEYKKGATSLGKLNLHSN